MSSAVKTIQLQMERLQEEMANTLKMEQDKQDREHKQAHLTEPNMEFMKGVLDKASALREYYDAEDPTTHWLHYAPGARECGRSRYDDRASARLLFATGDRTPFQSNYPAMIEFEERTTARKMEIIWRQKELYDLGVGGVDGDEARDLEFAALTKERKEFTDEQSLIRERAEQEYKNIMTISGRKPPPHLSYREVHVPAETDIKFLESVYNMFNIQSEQIKLLKVEIKKLKKDE
jgi:hypothetical protein